MAKLTLSLGSNLGDRHANLAAACEQIALRLGSLVYQSVVIETPAWGKTDQPNFLNQLLVCTLTADSSSITDLAYLHQLLDTTQQVEANLGRLRTEHWGARTIDIDLIFLDDLRYEDHRLSLPHPWWRQRAFVRDLLPVTFNPYLRIYDPA